MHCMYFPHININILRFILNRHSKNYPPPPPHTPRYPLIGFSNGIKIERSYFIISLVNGGTSIFSLGFYQYQKGGLLVSKFVCHILKKNEPNKKRPDNQKLLFITKPVKSWYHIRSNFLELIWFRLCVTVWTLDLSCRNMTTLVMVFKNIFH